MISLLNQLAKHPEEPPFEVQPFRYTVIEPPWVTAATRLPRAVQGVWKLATKEYGAGLHGTLWREWLCYLPEPIEITVITESDTVWFADSPGNFLAMSDMAIRAKGTVVVGGLGLGLLQHLLGANPAVSRIITVERAQELDPLVWRHGVSGEILWGDFWEILPKLSPDTIITDFILPGDKAKGLAYAKWQESFCKGLFPDAIFLEPAFQQFMDAKAVASSSQQPLRRYLV